MSLRLSLKQINDTERPRERCLAAGAGTLSLRECLALILGVGPVKLGCLGLAARILQFPGSGLGPLDEERAFFTLMEASGSSYLKSITGLGPAGQAKLLAAFEIGRRYAIYRYPQHRVESSQSKGEVRLGTRGVPLSQLAQSVLEKIPVALRIEPKEWLGFVPVYAAGRMGDLCVVEKGVRTHVGVDPVELFARILALRPAGFFLFHNHPSGSTIPSWQDRELTQAASQIAQPFGIQSLGHWIVTPQSERFIEQTEQAGLNV